MTAGHQLFLLRAAHRIKAKDLADEMGVYHTRVSQLEHAEEVSDDMARRYLSGLATLTGIPAESLSAAPGAAGPSRRHLGIARKLRALAEELES